MSLALNSIELEAHVKSLIRIIINFLHSPVLPGQLGTTKIKTLAGGGEEQARQMLIQSTPVIIVIYFAVNIKVSIFLEDLYMSVFSRQAQGQCDPRRDV